MKYRLVCSACGIEYNSSEAIQACRDCNAFLEVVYNGIGRMPREAEEFWDFEDLFPDGKYRHYEVGFTRLIDSVEEEGLQLKLEIGNPTRSFKDRGSVIEIAKAAEYGYKEVVCASTGNMAYSIAYYARLYGMKARVFIGGKANEDKIADIGKVGNAEIVRVKGDFNTALSLSEDYSRKRRAFLTGDFCYRKEGQKTLAYEIVLGCPEVTHIIVPVGNATLISGMYKALAQMKAAGAIRRMPRLVAVEAERCMPLVRAFRSGKEVRYERPKTNADAIAVGFPTFGAQALAALEKTGGVAIAVSENEMKLAQREFYRDYGLVAELAGVASIAAFKKLRLRRKEKAVAVISGGNV